MFCKKCGKEVKDGAAFCPHCGANVGQPTGTQQGQQTTISSVGGGMYETGATVTSTGSDGAGGKKPKNLIPIIGAGAAVVLVAVIVVVLLLGRSAGLVGEWKVEYDVEGLYKVMEQITGYGATAADLDMLEDAGMDLDSLPKTEGILKFHKDGTWEFYLDEKSFEKAMKKLLEEAFDAMVEEENLDKDDSEYDDLKEAYEETLEEMEDELKDGFLEVTEYSGEYEINKKKDEIKLTIKKAGGDKVSKSKAELVYKIKDGKLKLKIEEEDDAYIVYQLDRLGLFDEKLSK